VLCCLDVIEVVEGHVEVAKLCVMRTSCEKLKHDVIVIQGSASGISHEAFAFYTGR
jgi:hypothetical protein